jgi:hypothetical protein
MAAQQRIIICRITSFRVFLIVNTASSNPSFMDDFHPNTEVVLLSPNTTSLQECGLATKERHWQVK